MLSSFASLSSTIRNVTNIFSVITIFNILHSISIVLETCLFLTVARKKTADFDGKKTKIVSWTKTVSINGYLSELELLSRFYTVSFQQEKKSIDYFMRFASWGHLIDISMYAFASQQQIFFLWMRRFYSYIEHMLIVYLRKINSELMRWYSRSSSNCTC